MTTANIITLARIAMIPFFIACMYGQTPASRWAALILFCVASLTDGIDGYIARHYNQITNFGKCVDPLADKLLVIAAFLSFVEQGKMPAVCAIIIIARELIITSLRVVAMSQGEVMAASWTGKCKTVVQIAGIIIILLNCHFSKANVDLIVSWIITIVTIYSGIDYLWRSRRLISASVENKQEKEV